MSKYYVEKHGLSLSVADDSKLCLPPLPSSQPLQIKSVVAVEGLKGYIYVESYKQQFVKQAIEDIGNLRIGKWQQLMVPIKEMTDVLRVVKDSTGIKRGSWVRLKRSIYKDDIAQVGMTWNCVCMCGRSSEIDTKGVAAHDM